LDEHDDIDFYENQDDTEFSVEVKLPYKIQNKEVLEEIHNLFKVERIDDKLIFKVSVFWLLILFYSSSYFGSA